MPYIGSGWKISLGSFPFRAAEDLFLCVSVNRPTHKCVHVDGASHHGQASAQSIPGQGCTVQTIVVQELEHVVLAFIHVVIHLYLSIM